MDWIHDINEVQFFGKILQNAGFIAEELVAYYENPSEYNNLHLLWIEHGKPNWNDVGDWTGFVEAVGIHSIQAA